MKCFYYINASLLIACFLAIGSDSESCNSPGSVRLIWGAGNWEGLVQVCLNGSWGWVCQNGFGTQEAQVVCNQIGFTTSGVIVRLHSFYGWPFNGTIWIDNLNCAGTETSITNCGHTNAITNCDYRTIAGVICPGPGACSGQSVRLISRASGYRVYGRVEVCLNNQWGTVCRNGWSSTSIMTVCRELGFSSYYNTYYTYGGGIVPIAITNVDCSQTPNAANLLSCDYSTNVGSCTHSRDVGVYCVENSYEPSCQHGSYKLWRSFNTSSPANEGYPLVCENNRWKHVCNFNTNCHLHRVLCLEMGYAGAVGTRNYYPYGYFNAAKTKNRRSCSSSNMLMSDCSYDTPRYQRYWQAYTYYCEHSQYSSIFGLVCYSPPQDDICTNGNVRLVSGSTANEGRVEYCYEGNWSPFCDLSSTTASLICHQLGYNYTYASIFNDERFGRNNTLSSFNYKHCSNNQQSLSQCTDVRKTTANGCYISVTRCPIEYGIRCYAQSDGCTSDGQIRLVNGTLEQEGRIEICLNGFWGAICKTGWDVSDAAVLCKSLGYEGPNPFVYFDTHFGETNGPIIWSNIACNGYESSIEQCGKSNFLTFNCTQHNTAGVTCKDACTQGEIKLIGGKYSNEGTVLVCYNNMWGMIADSGWSDADAKVVCNSLGYTGGIAEPVLGSYYGKPKLIVHFREVSCLNSNSNLMQCHKTILSFESGKIALPESDVAGVDCIYNEPTECIRTPDWVSVTGTECQVGGSVRLVNITSEVTGKGRLEYCYNGYWSPFCNLDPVTATIICKQLGFTNYTAASIIPSDAYGNVRNFSLFESINCTGSETAISQCQVKTSECTPWCAYSNIVLTCYSPGTCTNGDVRLVDGYIENEGRVEICYNGVWGAICDQGWDATDAHVACTQMGHPELQPVVFTNSSFGGGQFPIVYSNFGCVGWENRLTDCDKTIYPQSSCSRDNIAGLLCGYDCTDGETRLVGSEYSYEGTVEVCYNNIWGLISDAGWSVEDAKVICRQLGYQTDGTIPYYGSQFGKPNKTIHLSNIQCTGYEPTINQCTRTSLSLQQGKVLLNTTNVAGVKCYTPDHCVPPPPLVSTFCTPGAIRLTGNGEQGRPEGNLQFCYKGIGWSYLCYLGQQEAIVACRQLGYTQYEVTAVFNDNRYGNYESQNTVTSLFQNISCSTNLTATRLSQCDMIDSCQSRCQYPVGLRCYEQMNCQDGTVRLVNGSSDEIGRLEICSNGIWGSVCGAGFDVTDAYVICRELGLGISEPTVYTNSYFGDGNEAILFSNFQCGGYEGSINDCGKDKYGSFTCSRDNVVGIVCRDNCIDTDIRLVGGLTIFEGTVEVCYYNTWGLVSDSHWTNEEAKVVCRQLNYNQSEAIALRGSFYGKPNRTLQLTNVACNGSQNTLDMCDKTLLSPEEGIMQSQVSVAGVHCRPTGEVVVVTSEPNVVYQSQSQSTLIAVVAILTVLFVIALIAIISLVSLTIKQWRATKLYAVRQIKVGMTTGSRAVQNPLADVMKEEEGEEEENQIYVDFDGKELDRLQLK